MSWIHCHTTLLVFAFFYDDDEEYTFLFVTISPTTTYNSYSCSLLLKHNSFSCCAKFRNNLFPSSFWYCYYFNIFIIDSCCLDLLCFSGY
ncbi:hypothetical protein KFK09_009158 [Dendrobium nobile]|uniref:Uncharacterized protein n=1 Tax=Dendrobium nobile TaxID=94219 RepID=A0A8T3BSS7_DENNO|nr:hypothetical protein KFK09_009158 [Dendrobium nobile]